MAKPVVGRIYFWNPDVAPTQEVIIPMLVRAENIWDVSNDCQAKLLLSNVEYWGHLVSGDTVYPRWEHMSPVSFRNIWSGIRNAMKIMRLRAIRWNIRRKILRKR